MDAEDRPGWTNPPRMIGGHVAGPVVIARSAGLVVAVRQVLAYPTGVEIEIEAHARGSALADLPADEPPGFGAHQQLRVRLRLADGTDVVLDDETGLRSGNGPMLVNSRSEHSSGGPNDREDVRMALWLWPLPPPGPVTVTCAWPRRGLGDAGIVLDGDAIRTAAGRAEPFWPETD